MPSCSDWNFSYGVGILVGAVIGIYYALDGWVGSEKQVEFKNSPRTKNLLWVLGGAFLGLIADLKPIANSSTHEPDRVTLLFWYFLSFVVASLGTVLALAVVVLVNNLQEQMGRRFNYTWLDALGAYLHYGWTTYSEQKRNAIRHAHESFHTHYVNQLAQTMLVIGQMSDAENLKITQQILFSIAGVVGRYRSDGSADIRANLMVVKRTDEIHKDRLKLLYIDEKKPLPTLCLDLIASSNGSQVSLQLPLPDESSSDVPLPGAPVACLSGEAVIIDDCAKLQFDKSISKDIQNAMKRYFRSKERSFRSFASLPIPTDGEKYSIVNINCSEPLVFGTDDADIKAITRNLEPFLCAIGILTSKLHPRRNS